MVSADHEFVRRKLTSAALEVSINQVSFSNPFRLRSLFLTSIALDKMQAFTRSSRPALQAVARRQAYSTSTSAYAATAQNLRVNKETRVIYQGFTGKQGT